MNLLNEANITKNSTKSAKTKYPISKIDIFFVIVIFIVIISPFAFNLAAKISADLRLVNLYISQNFEKIFGDEIAERLMNEFNEANPDIRVRFVTVQEERESDIVIFDIYDKIEVADETGPVLLVSFMDVLFYNIDILTEAGFDRPPRTIGEYQTYSKTAGDSGYYADDIFSPENNRPMIRKLEDFAKGRASMIIASTQAIPYFREKLGDEAFGISTIPSASDGSRGRYDIALSGIYAGIGKNSEYINEAWSFIEFLAEYRAEFCEMLKAVPGAVSDIIPGDYVQNDPFYSKAWDIFEYNQLTAGE